MEIDIRVSIEKSDDEQYHKKLIAGKLKTSPGKIKGLRLLKRSVDARPKPPVFQLRYRVWLDESPAPEPKPKTRRRDVSSAPTALIIGFGPAGMFAALQLIELGYKPIILERGKAVRERRRDLARINKEGFVNPDSNYCFGEGGAGTFSDGKLYTRSKKRGDIRRILETFVAYGATEEILIDAHPHIGTNKLPKIIQSIRESIVEQGGEIHFDQRVTDFKIKDKVLKGVETQDGTVWEAQVVLLATGHSARDIFSLLHRKKVSLESKPFALGVRVEHPQPLIDELRYRIKRRPEKLPPASYSLVSQALGHGVYSFCMCPGGIICPAATQNDELVVNGWSPSKRDSPYANSGIVVELPLSEMLPFEDQGPLAGVALQSKIEKQAFQIGGGSQKAPAQRLTDFVKGKVSQDLPDCSYLPGLTAANLDNVLPESILKRLKYGFGEFEKKMRGYLTEQAVVVATESRTSSPVKIPRDDESLMHPDLAGLFPCGEGAGYAGGIMSAALDGERCAQAMARHLDQQP